MNTPHNKEWEEARIRFWTVARGLTTPRKNELWNHVETNFTHTATLVGEIGKRRKDTTVISTVRQYELGKAIGHNQAIDDIISHLQEQITNIENEV